MDIPDTDRDICEPLDTVSVCQGLNNSEILCRPSHWAGEEIQEAVYHTQIAMHHLKSTLEFQVSPAVYNETMAKARLKNLSIEDEVNKAFRAHTIYFCEVVNVLLKLTPLAVLLLVYVSYYHIKMYLSSDMYDNSYITQHFAALDLKRAQVAGESLQPLKRYERQCLIDTSTGELSPPEEGLYKIGLCVFILHALISFTCYFFDYSLFWIISMIKIEAADTEEVTGTTGLADVVSGQGVIARLLDIFLENIHPGSYYDFDKNKIKDCLPEPRGPDLPCFLVLGLFYFLLLLTILLKAYILRLRNKISGYFYPERRKARIVHLYNVILNQRTRMPRLLHIKARVNYREQQIREEVGFCHKMGSRCPPCRIFLYKSSHCLVCKAVEDQTFRDCETEKCYGIYCSSCYDDLGRVCPICLHGNEYGEEEDCEVLEDDLSPYHRSSKIYL